MALRGRRRGRGGKCQRHAKDLEVAMASGGTHGVSVATRSREGHEALKPASWPARPWLCRAADHAESRTLHGRPAPRQRTVTPAAVPRLPGTRARGPRETLTPEDPRRGRGAGAGGGPGPDSPPPFAPWFLSLFRSFLSHPFAPATVSRVCACDACLSTDTGSRKRERMGASGAFTERERAAHCPLFARRPLAETAAALRAARRPLPDAVTAASPRPSGGRRARPRVPLP